MEIIASHGYDVYCLDVRGYGRSTRPKAMSEPPANNPPVARTPDAVKDITAVLNAVLKRRNISPSQPARLVVGLHADEPSPHTESGQGRAPDALRAVVDPHPPSLFNGGGPVHAYRLSARRARERWLNGVPEHKQAELIPAGWFEQWADAMWATDPDSGKQNPPVLRAPNGTLADTREYWTNGKTMYDPAKITVPTLIAVGEWDRDTPPYMAQTIFPLLVNSPGKRLVSSPRARTHDVERNRLELFKTVQAFLDEGARRTDAHHSLNTSSRFRFTAGSTRITSSASDMRAGPR